MIINLYHHFSSLLCIHIHTEDRFYHYCYDVYIVQVCFWLVENGLRVLIAACDTFRAGAVEQLRTHTRKLNALHPADMHNGVQMVQLYEKGYGKDAAGIAKESINFGEHIINFISFLFLENNVCLLIFVVKNNKYFGFHQFYRLQLAVGTYVLKF